MGNSLSKCNNETFTTDTTPLVSGQLKKVVTGMQENRVKYFATGIHQPHYIGYLSRVLKLILEMCMTDFLHNNLSDLLLM